MLTAVVSIAHVLRGLKYSEPVHVLSHVAPCCSLHVAQGGANKWTRKTNCLNDPQHSSEAPAWEVSQMLRNENENPEKKKSPNTSLTQLFSVEQLLCILQLGEAEKQAAIQDNENLPQLQIEWSDDQRAFWNWPPRHYFKGPLSDISND